MRMLVSAGAGSFAVWMIFDLLSGDFHQPTILAVAIGAALGAAVHMLLSPPPDLNS